MRTKGRTNVCMLIAFIVTLVIVSATVGWTQSTPYDEYALKDAFEGAKKVDLSKCKVSSVVTLRDVVKIPPPDEVVLVKTFDTNNLPDVLKPAFARPGIMGVTILNRYIAIQKTEFKKEYNDILAHELVHAYISLASPKPLPFWFQEGSAVHFSTDKEMKFYGKPDDKRIGVMVGKTVDLDPVYKQKLQSFQYMIKKVGDDRFNKWFRNAVETGNVDASGLVGIKKETNSQVAEKKRIPGWVMPLVAGTLIIVLIGGIIAIKRERELW